MPRFHTPVSLATALLLGLFVGQASAIGTSSSSINFTYTLIDLKPTDGVAASVVFDTTGVSSVTSYTRDSPGPAHSSDAKATSNTTFENLFEQASTTYATAYGSTTGNPGTSTGFTLTAAGQSGGDQDRYYSAVNLGGSNGLSFTLGANTLIAFSFVATGGATVTNGNSEGGTVATSSASLFSGSGVATQTGSFSATADSIYGPASWRSSVPQVPSSNTDWPGSFNENFGLSLYNGSSTSITGFLKAEVAVYGYSNATPALDYSNKTLVTPVPEPSSLALSLAGLGVVGAVVRRRKKTVASVS